MKLSEALSRDELRAFSKSSDLKGGLLVAGNIAILAGAFALAAFFPNPLTIAAALLLIAGRQLGFAIILHECAHESLFETKSFSRGVGKWLAQGLTDVPLDGYRAYHLNHHRHAGTPDDPDIPLVKGYPADPASMRRKFTRDLTGQTAFKEFLSSVKRATWEDKAPVFAAHVVMLAILALAGAAWTYLLWWVARIFLLPAFMRLRIIGEHGVATNILSTDPRDNTHTTVPRWWERLTVAPNNVSYHLEHHMFAAVPSYNLPKLHRLLSERGYYRGKSCVTVGYPKVLKAAVAPKPAAAAA
ncbi:MAG: fatty acid desaturase family protein [Pseudomonadota bacterium]